MCDLCELNKGGGFIITICRQCGIPLVCSREHKPEFSLEEKLLIEKMFPDKNKRWEMRVLPDHAHCHIENG